MSLFDGSGLFGGKKPSSGITTKTIHFRINNGDTVIPTGVMSAVVSSDIAGTITKYRVLTDTSATLTAAILKDTYANFPPTEIDDIGTVSLTADIKAEDSTLSGWTKTVSVGDIFKVEVLTNDNAKRIDIFLEVQ